MSRSWNGQAVIDRVLDEIWDSSTTMRARAIIWANEIQDDIAQHLRNKWFKIKLQKLLPTGDENINLAPEKPGAPTAATSSGGSLANATAYQALVTFLIYNEDGSRYIESVAGTASAAQTTADPNLQLDLTAIPTYSGDTSEGLTIHRRVYLITAGSEPFFIGDIQDNTTTTYTIAAASSSTISPPSDSEVAELAADHMRFATGNRWLEKYGSNQLTRYDPDGASSATPYAYADEGFEDIRLYPKLSASATTAQRTLIYYVYRRPHEIFYESTRPIDLPIQLKKLFMLGMKARAAEFRDWNGWQSLHDRYEAAKTREIYKLTRQKGRPLPIRDVNGTIDGFEV